MFNRSVRGNIIIAYLAILSTAIAALFGAPVLAILPGAAVLLSLSLREQRKLSDRFAAIGSTHILDMAGWQSAGHAVAACGAAYIIGLVTRLASGH